MPHVIFRGGFDLQAWATEFEFFEVDEPRLLIKVEEIYVNQRGSRAILPMVVVEEGHSQNYFVRLSYNPNNERLSVKIDPATDPVKTRGVKRSIAVLSQALLNFAGRQGANPLKVEHHTLGRLWSDEWVQEAVSKQPSPQVKHHNETPFACTDAPDPHTA
mgnify:CR=1 FL=1